MRKAGVAHSKSSKDMESHVFLKAKTRVRPRWAEQTLEALLFGEGKGLAPYRIIMGTVSFSCSSLWVFPCVHGVSTGRLLGGLPVCSPRV